MLRTVAEFLAAGVPVHLWCGQCGDTHLFGADALELTFGPDFDLVGNPRELARQLYCPECGARRLSILKPDAPDEAEALVVDFA
jgi:hypothetical protein